MSKPLALSRVHGMDAIELVAPDGARATVLLHGGHLVSWQPTGAEEQLYMSPKSEFASGQAIRGGVPVIFPQFAARGPLQRHGFARTKPWALVMAEQGKDDALAVLRLSDDAATRMFWPHAFELELSVRISGREIQIELACENKGEEAFEFTAALHSYLRVADIDSTSLQGLTAMRYWDSVDEMEKVQRVDLLLPGGQIDRIYHRVRENLTLRESLATTERRLQIAQQGFEDAVVWNPGAEKCAALADMPADGYKQMLCVEAAAIETPLRLGAGESWAGMQTLTLL
ncbi:D-hexose-6-phosphate mutarotase [Paucibacter sp. B2R-40]|uniref:D-hexose-6-phosphate mutarotase n=1 Tax=Paucibacter sp. B2R-40 TaxID=2893554 RepID=UPI0021E4D546|nr:D-hexose-6-phosphate mutarotase [Paucibacter sp. B2R-40]MCV2353224.1 D-hexose-6-phosphate mutarotase [Paucibacter sp. B2R-40]